MDWVASNPRSLSIGNSIGNLEVIYENDEVGVVLHDADSDLAELGKGKVMAVYTKRMINFLRLGS